MKAEVEFAGNRGEGRYYKVTEDGTSAVVPSVTSVLGMVWPKPWAFAWAAKEERNLVVQVARQYALGLAGSRYNDALERITFGGIVEQVNGRPMIPLSVVEAMIKPSQVIPTESQWQAGLGDALGTEKANRRISKKATDRGKLAHAKIEHRLAQWLEAKNLPPWPTSEDKAEDDAAEIIFMQWEDWAKSVSLKPYAVEQRVGSLYHGTAGTIDCVGTFLYKGAPVWACMDWKGSRAIYPDHKIQGSVYRMLWNWNVGGPDLTHVVVARFPSSFDQPEFDPARDILVLDAEEARSYLPAFAAMQVVFALHEAEEQAAKASERAAKAAAKGTDPGPAKPRRARAKKVVDSAGNPG